jgi:hypothetical protein
MNSQDILRILGFSLDIKLDNSETFDYTIAEFDTDYDQKTLSNTQPFNINSSVENYMGDTTNQIDTIKLCEIDTGLESYSGITYVVSFEDFVSHFNTENYDYENILLNNDVFTYTGLTHPNGEQETHYFKICGYNEPIPPTPTPTVTLDPDLPTPTPWPTSTPEISPSPTPTSTTVPNPFGPTPTPTSTFDPNATPNPTATSTPTPTPSYGFKGQQPTPTPTQTQELEPSPTPTIIPSSTPLPTGTATPTPTIIPSSTPLPTNTQTPEPTNTQTPEPTSTVELTPNPTNTETPVPTSTGTPEPTNTETPIPTNTETPEPTSTETPIPTNTQTPEPTNTQTPEPTNTETPIPTSTETPIPTNTETPVPTSTETPIPTNTETPIPTNTETPIPTDNPTATPQETPVPTSTPLPSATPQSTPDPTITPNPTATPIPTETQEPTATPTGTPLPTSTQTPEPTTTPNPTATEVPTATPMPTSTQMPTPEPTSTIPPTSTPQATPNPTATSTYHHWFVKCDVGGPGDFDIVFDRYEFENLHGIPTVLGTTLTLQSDPTTCYVYSGTTTFMNITHTVNDINDVDVCGCPTPVPTQTQQPTPEPTATIPPPTPQPTSTPLPTSTPQPAWSPNNDILPVAWIDASDSSNYQRSGTSLLGVTDKAGTYTMTVGGNPLTNSSTQNGLNVFDFDGNSDFLQSTTYRSQVSSGNHFALGVFRFESTNNTKNSLWSYEYSSTTNKRDYAISAGATNNTWPGELDLDGLSTNRISSTIGNLRTWDLKSLTRNQYHIVSCWFNKTGNQIGVRVDGSNAFTPVNDYDNSLQTTQELRLMRNRSSVELDGKMGEFIAYASMPGTSGTDMTYLEKAEGYLAHKWGLTSSLPSSHPYKNIEPTL